MNDELDDGFFNPNPYEENIFPESNYGLPMRRFWRLAIDRAYPSEYGNRIAKKIIYDLNGTLIPIRPDLDAGDAVSINGKNIELKVSVNKKAKGGRYNIKNIRDFQEIDFFVLSFGNKSDGSHYCITKEDLLNHPALKFSNMNSSKQANAENKNVPKATSFKCTDMEWLFDPINQLKDNKYSSLLEFYGVSKFERAHEAIEHKPDRTHAKRTKVSFNVDGVHIQGNTNMESVIKLVKHIGPEKLVFGFNNCFLSHRPNKYRTVVIGEHYLNPKMGIRDIKINIHNVNLLSTRFRIPKIEIIIN